jgi:hypothetical protein
MRENTMAEFAQPLGDGVELGCIDVRDGNVATLAAQRLSDGGAQAASATEYQCRFSIDPEVHLVSPSFLHQRSRMLGSDPTFHNGIVFDLNIPKKKVIDARSAVLRNAVNCKNGMSDACQFPFWQAPT